MVIEKEVNANVKIYVIKRSGKRVFFDTEKLKESILRANEKEEKEKLCEEEIEKIIGVVQSIVENAHRELSTNELQDIVEKEISKYSYDVFCIYHDYRLLSQKQDKMSALDEKIAEILDVTVRNDGSVKGNNEAVIEENSNKNPTVLSVQRDYIAGEWCRHYTEDYLIPEDIRKANEEGIIHFHDSDYFPMKQHNCCLINLEDMLQNGTCISGTMIEKPKSFATACTVASQISAAVASSQYGGQTMSLSHLAPFVDISRRKIKGRLQKEWREAGLSFSDNQLNEVVEKEVIKEVADGCQTIQYQLITLHSTNGQAPFITLFMYLNEVPEGQVRNDLALIIKTMLEQRLLGVKDKSGAYITPAFPKLIYVLSENNIYEDSEYFWLTELAAKCTAKRMVPDYISEKIMKELKGDVYPCMGCVDGQEVISYKYNGSLYVESFERMWNRLSRFFVQKFQPGRSKDMFLDLAGVEIYDNKDDWTKCRRLIKNASTKLLRLKFTNGRVLTCTPDHPFETENRGVVNAAELTSQDVVSIDKDSMFFLENNTNIGDKEAAWMYGLLLCDSSYVKSVVVSIAASGEEEIKNRFIKEVSSHWGLECDVKLQKRERKGTYQDIRIKSDGGDSLIRVCNELTGLFGGIKKCDRHIPNEVFSWGKEARMAFLAGMMDADGYIDDNNYRAVAFLGSTNKELALQQVLLVQSLGMKGSIYLNHYKDKGRADSIRYTLKFYPRKELISAMTCEKKTTAFCETANESFLCFGNDTASLISVEEIGDGISYDVTTESGHFTVSGIYSHNCRSFLTPDRFTDAGINNIENRSNYVTKQHRYYGRLTHSLRAS